MVEVYTNHKEQMMIVGGNIRRHRKAMSLDVVELSILSRVSEVTIKRLEAGYDNVTLETLVKLSNVFKCDPSELLKLYHL
jgi:transcriptional regulator with XRE-family HTH domain